MREKVELLAREHRFDAVVCDFLIPAPSMGDILSRAVLFQHNIETLIWRRRAEQARDPLRRFYLRQQASRMFSCEREFSHRARHVVAVSDADAERMREMFDLKHVSSVPTGVDLDYFQAPDPAPAGPRFDIVFVGSMDWMPNQDGVQFFLRDILPRIRQAVPEASVGIVGRQPPPELLQQAAKAGGITVTGTVPDVRPYLWGARMSIVPLRIGGGTRLKIYESMAAGTPVVSTTIGAEGLDVRDGENICRDDSAEDFAAACTELLQNEKQRARLAAAGRQLVVERFSWDKVTDRFEQILLEYSGR
jgi:glycosyltransferase involved in cell wall biosynthesis